MPDDVRDQLRSIARWADAHHDPIDAASVQRATVEPARSDVRRPHRRVLVAAAVVVVLATGAGLVALRERDRSDVFVDIPAAPTTSEPVRPFGAPTAAGWQEGATYGPDPATDLALAGLPSTVWGGDEVLAWNGLVHDASGTLDLVSGPTPAFDPVLNRWRELPERSAARPIGGTPVWTGNELVLAESDGSGLGASALDPATGTWRQLADPPREVQLGRGVWADGTVVYYGLQTIVTYVVATDTWRVVVGYPDGLAPEHNRAVWDGAELIAVDTVAQPQRPTTPAAFAIDITTGASRQLADPPFRVSDLVWTGTQVLGIADDGAVAAWDRASDRWTVGSPAPFAARGYGQGSGLVAWTGDRMVVWGGQPVRANELGPAYVEGPTFTDGGLYDPVADTWTPIPPVDLQDPALDLANVGRAAVWADDRLLVIAAGGDRYRTLLWSPG